MTIATMDLSRKVALVTGGGRGLGRGMAGALAAAGATVVLSSRTEPEVVEAERAIEEGGGSAWALPWDLGDGATAPELVSRVVDRYGQIDVLVHAAGNQVRRPALELEAAQWDEVVGLHLRAAFLLAQAVGRCMVERGEGGSIVFVGSVTSTRWGGPNLAAYCAAKSGLLGLMRSLAVEWGSHGIRVNAILPGFFPTEMTRDVDDSPVRRALTGRTPLQRLGRPDELGGAVLLLSSEAGSYISGEAVTVDGGWSSA
ncbi:MAG: SDR family NAD(P)-dependent oxidoreductase [Actinomycetota bacterium]